MASLASRPVRHFLTASTRSQFAKSAIRQWTSYCPSSIATRPFTPFCLRTISSPSVVSFIASRGCHRTFHQLTRSREPETPKSPSTNQPISKRLRALTPLPHENIWTIPNILTFSRLFAAPVVGYLLLHEQHAWAFSLFVYAGVTDLVDGWIARRYGSGTVVGSVIDPMADKTLMTIVTVTLAANGAMPVYLAVLILGRDVLLAMSAIYYRYISLPPPKTFARYWDFSLPSAEVRPTGISKVNTALQLGLIGVTMGMPLVDVGAWAYTALTGFQYTVAMTTVWSGASYIYNKDAVKILNQDISEEDQSKQKENEDQKL